MAFVVPTFPMEANIWRFGIAVTDPPSLTSPVNVAFGRRVTTADVDESVEASLVVAYLLFPRGTDVRDRFTAPGADVIEAPAGSGRFYSPEYVNDLGGGFPNEHRFAACIKLAAWPAPLPPIWVPPAG